MEQPWSRCKPQRFRPCVWNRRLRKQLPLPHRNRSRARRSSGDRRRYSVPAFLCMIQSRRSRKGRDQKPPRRPSQEKFQFIFHRTERVRPPLREFQPQAGRPFQLLHPSLQRQREFLSRSLHPPPTFGRSSLSSQGSTRPMSLRPTNHARTKRTP